jgi:small-conductance mechanosensitive channel
MWDVLYSDIANPNTPEGAVCYAIAALVLAILAARLVRAWSHRLGTHPSLFIDRTAASFLGQLMQVACFLIAATFYAHLVPSLHKLGNALLASASIVSLVLGLAAQSTLGNLISGVALLLYRPFGIGDVLVVNAPTGKETGTVEDFTLGYTKLLTEDERRIVVPNSVMVSSVIIRVERDREKPKT